MSKLNKAWERIDRKVSRALKKAKKPEMVHYSAYESDEDDNPIDNLDEVAIKGQAIIVLEADDFYGGKSSVEYRSPIEKDAMLDEIRAAHRR